MAPRVRAEAAVIVDLARRAARRRPRQRVAAFAARDQSLNDAWLDGPAGREALVVGQALRRQSKSFVADDGRNRYLDPLVTRPLVTTALFAVDRPPRQAEGPRHLLPWACRCPATRRPDGRRGGLPPGRGLIGAACAALGLSRASFHRRTATARRPSAPVRPRPRPARALALSERQAVLDLLREPRFVDQPGGSLRRRGRLWSVLGPASRPGLGRDDVGAGQKTARGPAARIPLGRALQIARVLAQPVEIGVERLDQERQPRAESRAVRLRLRIEEDVV